MAVKLSRDCDLRLNVSDSTVILPWSFLDVRSFEEEGKIFQFWPHLAFWSCIRNIRLPFPNMTWIHKVWFEQSSQYQSMVLNPADLRSLLNFDPVFPKRKKKQNSKLLTKNIMWRKFLRTTEQFWFSCKIFTPGFNLKLVTLIWPQLNRRKIEKHWKT